VSDVASGSRAAGTLGTWDIIRTGHSAKVLDSYHEQKARIL
jgi:hypothetical protein